MSVECIGKTIFPNGDAECSFYDSETGYSWKEVIEDYMDKKEDLFRVSFFSMWEKPNHYENLTMIGKELMVKEGKAFQYSVVVTLMTEPEPETF